MEFGGSFLWLSMKTKFRCIWGDSNLGTLIAVLPPTFTPSCPLEVDVGESRDDSYVHDATVTSCVFLWRARHQCNNATVGFRQIQCSYPGSREVGGGGGERHQQEHWPQRPTERSDPTQHAKGRTGDCPGPRKGATTRRHVTRGVQICAHCRCQPPKWDSSRTERIVLPLPVRAAGRRFQGWVGSVVVSKRIQSPGAVSSP